MYDRLALALVMALIVLVVWTFGDYGITTDEYVQHTYGEKLWAFYLSGMTDRSVFAYDNLYLYGGLFDMVAVAIGHISPIGEYETRHVLCGLIGVLGVVGVWRLARRWPGRGPASSPPPCSPCRPRGTGRCSTTPRTSRSPSA